MFSHERFEAYTLAIEFAEIALHIVDQIPSGHSSLKDQLRRAAFSIALNIAEGTEKFQSADRIRFYSIARGSAMECAAICDIAKLTDPRLETKVEDGKRMLKSIVNILTAVCKKGMGKG